MAHVPELDDGPAFTTDELYAAGHPYRGSNTRWHRPVAWAMAVVMGIGVVALTFAAVYRGAGGGRQPVVPPTTGPVGTRTMQPVVTTPLP